MSNDYFKAQGWFKTYALNSQDSRGMFQRLVKEDEEAFRLASAETDKIKAMMNEKYGSGTMKYGSEIKQPEMKTPQAIFEFSQRNPAAEGGQMVKPSADGSRPGYAGTKKTKTTKVINKLDLDKKKIKLNGDNFITGKVQSYVSEGVGKKYVDEYLSFVDKNYLKNDMSMVEPFQAYIKNKYPKKFSKIISDVNQSGYRGLKDISTTYKKSLANELITAANNQIKYVDQFDILKKLVSPTRAAAYERSGGLSARPPEWADKNTLNNFKNLDKMEDKLSKSLTYIVDNNVEIINPKNLKIPGSGGKIEGASPIKKMMHYLAGGGSQANLNKALEINPWYQSQNFKVGDTTKNTFDYLSRQYAKDFIGQPFNDAYDFALQRRGRISLKGMKNQPLPENLIWEFAARSAQRNFTDGVPIEQWPVKILDKKGNVVDLGKFPVDSSGRKLLNTSELQFEYNGETFNRNNLKTKGVESGFFNDIYKVSSQFDNYLKQPVPDPDNPKKTISLRELFDKTEGRIFPTIGHDDARGGVKKRPFNSFKILTNVENLSLYNAYDKITNPKTRKNVVNFIYGETKGLRGDRYKEAWTNKNVSFVTEYIKTGKGLEETPYKQKLKEIDYIDGKGGTTLSSGFNTDLLMKDPAVQKILNSKAGQAVKNAARGTAGTVGKVFGGIDIVIGALDYENNISKGQKPDEALGNAVQAMSFNLYKSGDRARVEDVKERFVAKGGDAEIFDQATALNAKDQELNDLIFSNKKKADTFVRYAKEGRGTLTPDLEKSKADYNVLKKNLNEEIKNKIQERDNMVESYKTNLRVSEAGAPIQIGNNEFFSQPFKDIKQSTMDKIAEENRKAYDMQKRQVNFTSGNIGNFLQNNIFTMNPQEKAELQRQINNMDERELYKFNLSRGMDPDNLIRFEDLLNIKSSNPDLMGVNTTKYVNYDDRKAEGGITELRSKYEYKK